MTAHEFKRRLKPLGKVKIDGAQLELAARPLRFEKPEWGKR